MFYISDIKQVPLNPRPSYDAMIVRGQPQAAGRIVSLSGDRRTAYVIWRGTPGNYLFKPDPRVIDVGYITCGKLAIHQLGKKPIGLAAGSLIEFPRDSFEMEITETFMKVSFLYATDGLALQVESLPLDSGLS